MRNYHRNMRDNLYKILPHFLQNLMVTLFNVKEYRRRLGGEYKEFLTKFNNNRDLSRKDLLSIQKARFENFVDFTIDHSLFYQNLYNQVDKPIKLQDIGSLPIVDKETIRSNIEEVVITIDEKLSISKTGGTTGKSLEVKKRNVNIQERFALVDDFRSRFGYELGKKTAWFSGKNLLTSKDIKKRRFWKKDYFNNVRYYSTFHIKQDHLKYYIEDLIKFKPEYMVGFPSTLFDIAKYGISHGYNFPSDIIKAIFPTAETLTKEMRQTIETFFNTKMYDQYASSEGAPFIFECKEGSLHMELQSGIFEVLDENDEPTNSGRLVVTSFTTEGTPLIRYDIGDSIVLDNPHKKCNCGNNNPMALEILGRIDDYIYSPENGKINLGNISNTLKGTSGIRNFQVVQNTLEALDIYLIIEEREFSTKIEKVFIENWQNRVGKSMKLNLNYVTDIPVETSGKFRIVKNNIKHLLDTY